MPRRLEASAELSAPRSHVYACLVAFEQYPSFLPGVLAVRRVSPRRLVLVGRVGDEVHEWPARISEQRRDRSVALTLDQRLRVSARVQLESVGPEETRIAVEVDYALDPLRERLLNLLFDPQQQLDAGLERFVSWVAPPPRAGAARPARA